MGLTWNNNSNISVSGSGTANDPFVWSQTNDGLDQNTGFNLIFDWNGPETGVIFYTFQGTQGILAGEARYNYPGLNQLLFSSWFNPFNIWNNLPTSIILPSPDNHLFFTVSLPPDQYHGGEYVISNGAVWFVDESPPVQPYSLYVINQPSLVSSGSLLSPQPSIGIKDQFDNVLTNFDTDVQVSLVVLSGSATLTGTDTVSTTSGVATFTDLVITGNGQFYLHFESTILALNAVDSNQLFFPPDPGNPNPPIPVKPKRSYVVGSVPTANDLEINEFAINVADRKGYMRDSNDIVHLLFDGYATGGGGSGGTVYSVGVSSQDLTVTNSPITSSGFIGLELNTQSITAGAYGDASNVAEVTVNDKGIVTGIQNVAISYPVNSITAGTDISLTGTAPDYTINNTAPDQIVSLISGTGVSVSGTYPNFTIDCTITQYTDTDARLALSAGTGISYDNTTGVISNSDPDQIVSLTSGTGINVTGTYPSFTIDSTITQYTDADARLSLSAGTGISYDNTTGVISNSDPDQVVSLTAGTDISITGTYPNFTIDYTGTSGSGTVTSVGITSTASALTITNTPITTSGNIGVNFSGKGSEYVTGDGSLKTFPTIIEQALELITEVYNETGATLTKGTVVRINGGHGNLPTITKAQADSDANSAQTYGVVQDDITDQNNGYVVVIGMLNDLDTQTYSAGTQLYLSPTTAGAWTSTKPSAPNHLVYVGVVVRSHPTQGVVEIKIQNGYELDELHDVSITSVAPNNILRYNSSTKLWENVAGTTSSISEGSNLYYTDARARASVSAGTGISYSSSTGVITNSSPDQTVVLTAGTGISTSGTYPNFTVTNSSPDQTVVLTAGTNISITGTYPNFTINASGGGSGTVTSVDMTVPTGFKVSGNPVTTTGTLAVVYDTGYALPTSAKQTNWDTAYTNRITSLTTTGSSGSATLVSNTLNVPTYTLSGLGGQASSTNLTSLSGLTYVSASFVKMTASGTFSLDTSTYLTANQTITLSGDVTGSGSTAITTTLATVGATKGGTGQTTYTLGDTLYCSASNTLSKLSGNTTSTRKFLRQTGTGTISAAPAWDTVTKTDVGLSNVENTALSTWTGSSSITTLGTLGALTVSGTTVINSLTYPSADGTSGQFLSTNGSGTLSWATATGSSAGGSQGDIQYNDGSGGFTAGSYFNYGTSAYDALALYSSNASFGVFGIFGASGQTYPLLEFRDYTGTTVYSYFDATGNLYLNAQTDIRFADADSSNYAAIQAPTTIATNYTLTLPTTAGTNNYVLKTNGSGTLSWANAITNLIGGNSTTLLGSIPYQSNTDTTTLLSPNTTTTKKFLRQTGTGTNGAAPAWDTVVAADIASGQIALAYGGTNANLTAVNGAVAYSTASALALTAAGTSGQVLTSGGAGSPTWVNQGLFSGGRLTLTSGTPVTTSDVTSATTIYYTPYNGDRISLYDGTNWATYTFTERSLSLGTLTSGKNYDVFLYNNSGTLTLELSAAWTNDTTRADALTLANNGIYVKSSSTTRRYLGTIRTTSTTTTEDSATKRFVYNANNRVTKTVIRNETTSTWTYQSTTWRQANNSTSNQVAVVAGLAESMISLSLKTLVGYVNQITGASIGIGQSSTTTPDTDCLISRAVTFNPATVASGYADAMANLNKMVPVGYYYYTWLETSQASYQATFYGVDTGNSPPTWRYGLNGSFQC